MLKLQFTDFLTKEIVGPFIIVIGCIIFHYILKAIIKRMFKLKIKVSSVNYQKQQTLSSLVLNVLKYIMFIIAILMLLELYGIDTKSILASLGLVGIVIGLALQDVAKDIIAGFTIIFEDQYNIGDTIEINGFKGEVTSIGLKSTVLKKYDGEVKIISNRNISEVINFSKAHDIEYINIPVSYDANLKQVEEVLTKVCNELTEDEKDIVEPMKVLGVNNFEDSAVTFLVSLETLPTKHFAPRREFLRRVKIAFDEVGIEIPFTQVVIHNEQ